MKPPPRKRTRKSRELGPVPQPRGRAVCKWPLPEQKRLLAALNRLSPGDMSAGLNLDPERVREHLPQRSAAEINSVLEALKERVILFAKNKEQAERREERRAQKPLDMWIQQASALTGGVEESLSSAFNQMLTVASIEPRTPKSCAPPEHHSPAPPQSKDSTPGPSASSSGSAPPAQSPVTKDSEEASPRDNTPTAAQRPLVSATAPRPPVRTPPVPPSPMTAVSFEKIYYYLSALHKPSEQCKLTPMESAIVLDLLMSLPEELLLLDCDKLSEHLSQVYLDLSSSNNLRKTRDSPKGVKETHSSDAPDPQQPQPASEDSPQRSTDTKVHSPLNPFLIPLSLLSRKAQTNPT